MSKELLDLSNKGIAGELQVDEVEETDFSEVDRSIDTTEADRSIDTKDVEVIPLSSNEIVGVLGSLDIDEVDVIILSTRALSSV